MTTEHNLAVAKECGLTLWPKEHLSAFMLQLDAYTARICAEKDAEIAKLKQSFAEVQHNQATLIGDYQQQLSEANAKIAMIAEALLFLRKITLADMYKGRNIEVIDKHLSATSADVAAWEREKGAKVLEIAAAYFYTETEYAPVEGETFERPELILRRMAAELRSQNTQDKD